MNQHDIEGHEKCDHYQSSKGLTKKEISKVFKNRHGSTLIKINGKKATNINIIDGVIHISNNSKGDLCQNQP